MIDKDIAYADALELLAEVASCGVEYEAPTYVTVQIARITWNELAQYREQRSDEPAVMTDGHDFRLDPDGPDYCQHCGCHVEVHQAMTETRCWCDYTR